MSAEGDLASVPRFVQERRATWDALDQVLQGLHRGRPTLEQIDDLDRLYRRCSADLAEARRRFPGTAAVRHVNELVTRAHAELFVARPSRWAELRRFAAVTFPRTFIAELRYFAVAAGILGVSGWLGATLVVAHPEAVAALVPSSLREHIAEGRMWTDSILEVMPPALLSARVLTNNIGVALGAFAGGLAWGLGTVVVITVNGLELGSVVALCVQRGMAGPLLTFVVGHGLVELSTLCIAGQAGLVLASALINPGGARRIDALRDRGRAAARLLLGAIPILFCIGLVEGFVSPGGLFPPVVHAAVGFSLVTLLYAYLFRLGRAPVTAGDASPGSSGRPGGSPR